MRFLIVDDDQSITDLLGIYLAPYAEVVTARTGQEGIDAFTASFSDKRPFQAVFMDITLPGMTGHDVVQEMRRLEGEYGIKGHEAFKLFMISAHSDTKNVCQSFFRGHADAYITKPLQKGKLLEELRNNKLIA